MPRRARVAVAATPQHCPAPVPSMVSNLTNLGSLLEASENGCRLPEGFSCRVIASSSSPVVDGSEFLWHGAADGGTRDYNS